MNKLSLKKGALVCYYCEEPAYLLKQDVSVNLDSPDEDAPGPLEIITTLDGDAIHDGDLCICGTCGQMLESPRLLYMNSSLTMEV